MSDEVTQRNLAGQSLSEEPPAAASPPLTVGDESLEALERRVGVVPSRLGVLVVGLLLAVLAIFVFGFLARDVYQGESLAVDQRAGYFLHGYSTRTLDLQMWLASLVGSTFVIAPLLLGAIVLLLRSGYRREAVFLGVAMLGGVLLNRALKVAFERPRPALPWSQPIGEFSFPSGHSMNSFVAYMSLAVVVWVVLGRRAGLVAFGLAMLIVLTVGISRIYLGYHYFTDVVAGYSAGLLWLLAAATAVESGRKVYRRRRGAGRARMA